MFQQLWTVDGIRSHIIGRSVREPLNYHYYATHYPDVHAAAIRLYGSWKAAVEDCGFNYKKILKYRKWSKTKLVNEIAKMHSAGDPISSKYVQDNHKSMYMTAIRYFKSWGRAVAAAGIEYQQVRVRHYRTVEEIKRKIVELHDSGFDLAYTSMRTHHSYLLAAAMKKVGNGSWDRARRACGVEINFRARAQQRRRVAKTAEKQKEKENV